MSGPVEVADGRKWNFCIVGLNVIDDERLSAYDKVVYLALCRFAGIRNGECFPSLATIAGKAGCSRSQVIRALTHLEELDYVKKRQRKDGAKNLTSIYSILGSSSQTLVPDRNQGSSCEEHRTRTNELEPDRTRTNELEAGSTPPTTPPNVTEQERQVLNILKETPRWKFRYETDLKCIRDLATDYPGVDLLDEVKKLRDWLIDKPLKKSSNPRLRLRNWIKNARKFKSTPPRGSQGQDLSDWLDGLGLE